MKNKGFKLVTLLVIFAIVFVACKKDTNDVKGHIEYDGSQYELTKGSLTAEGSVYTNPVSYHFRLVVLSSAASYYPSLRVVNGTGNGVIVDIYSSSTTDLIPGTYTFNASRNANTFDWGAMAVEFDFSTLKKASANGNILSGTLTIGKSGSDYDLTFNGTITGGKSFTASYKGALNFYNDSK